MERSVGKIQALLLCLLSFLSTSCKTLHAQPGFLSIDCGSAVNYTDSATGIVWVTDDAYISTGVNAPNITVQGSSSDITENPEQMKNLRYFQSDRARHCYVLPTRVGYSYVVRANFYLGDFRDPENTIQNAMFDTYINDNLWLSMTFDGGSYRDYNYYFEAVIVSQRAQMDVCLVPFVRPTIIFISALELRELSNGMYSAMGINHFMNLQIRLNTGVDQNSKSVRFPGDQYDRIWSAPGSWDNATHLTAHGPIIPPTRLLEKPPPKVMETAWVYYNSNIWFWQDFGTELGDYHLVLYFQELDGNATATRVRGINLKVNDDKILATFNTSDAPSEVSYSPPPGTFKDRYLNFSLEKTSWTKLDPILNAFEIYQKFQVSNANTHGDEVVALTAVKTSFSLQDWTGDPCTPVPWDWLNCTQSTDLVTWQVSQMKLSRRGLQSTIPPEIGKLTALTHLWLDNNKLYGPIPDLSGLVNLQELHLENNHLNGSIPVYLANLKNLTRLSLDFNNLSGIVPPALVARTQSGLLLTFKNNSGLVCNTTGCGLIPSGVSSTGKSSSNVGAIVGSVVGVFVVLILVALCFWFYYVRKARRDALSPSLTDRKSEALSYAQIVAATNNFRNQIGKGGYGPVYYGKLENGQEVAVKTKANTSRQGNEFLNEVRVLSRVHHNNLVSLVGYCADDDRQDLVYAYMCNGTLRELLQADSSGSGRPPLGWRTRLGIALNAARGLEYLHTDCSPRIIHRDIKTSNILLDENLVAKVSDFGLSRVTLGDHSLGGTTGIKGTVGYIDPEYYLTEKLTPKSDVYSFGVVLCELMSGMAPNHMRLLDDGSKVSLLDLVRTSMRNGDLDAMVDPVLKDAYYPESMWKVAELAWVCVDPKPANRPDMGQVVRTLTEAFEAETAALSDPSSVQIHSNTAFSVSYPSGSNPSSSYFSGSNPSRSLPSSTS